MRRSRRLVSHRWGSRSKPDALRAGNRFCILPMEGWDGTTDGRPSDLTMRRWRHFGASGAKLIWGGEAVAVCPEGRANPNQLVISDHTKSDLANLLIAVAEEHESAFGDGATKDLCIGLQLTHSGRFARPSADGPAPLVAYEHPVLDKRSGAAARLLLDSDLDRLVEQFVEAARHAADIGFQFVDIKHCHGYLLHELLSARSRRGKYGGALENRTRFLRDTIDGIRASAPALEIGVRLSVFDTVPFRKGPGDRGEPEVPAEGYTHAFGLIRDDDVEAALAETREVLHDAARAGRALDLHDGRESRITARTFSVRPCSRRATATSRRRIRCAVWPGR